MCPDVKVDVSDAMRCCGRTSPGLSVLMEVFLLGLAALSFFTFLPGYETALQDTVPGL